MRQRARHEQRGGAGLAASTLPGQLVGCGGAPSPAPTALSAAARPRPAVDDASPALASRAFAEGGWTWNHGWVQVKQVSDLRRVGRRPNPAASVRAGHPVILSRQPTGHQHSRYDLLEHLIA
ncbi:hypothetical protein VTN96DRAFT_3481 [Rasamsonia emersonii]